MRNGLVAFALGGMILPVLFGSGPVEVKMTPEIREYCHVVRFPIGWRIPNFDPVFHQPLSYEYDSAYEFRIVGRTGTDFLVAGLAHPYETYTTNKYSINLSDPAGVAKPATDEEWQGAAAIADTGRADDQRRFAPINLPLSFTNDTPLPFHGILFVKSGNHWAGTLARLSPNQAWIVLVSSSGKVAQRADYSIYGRDKGRLFFDIFNATTGKKMITIIGTYRDIEPGHAMNQCRWVTERYFIVPLGEHRERCLVCDFGRAAQNAGAGR